MATNRKSAFTLIELLVVIMIIGILVGILIPVVTVIKKHGYAATTLAQINALRGAIEAYQGTYNAYPGPIPDHHMYQLQPGQPPLPAGVTGAQGSGMMTMSENMVLGLMGGPKDVNGTITFDPNLVGSGPRSLNPGNPAQHAPFYTNTKELTQGFFSDKVDNAGKPIASCFDSSVPEFVDKFQEPLPIIYLRARRGAKGVMSDQKNYNAMNPSELYQYDVRQYYSYICDPSGGTPSAGIVVGGKKQEYRVGGQLKGAFWDIASADPRKGIADPATGGSGDPLINAKNGVNFAIAYFRNPPLSVDPSVTNESGSPRSKDGFILISAGADRLFGTADDLASFGSVLP